MKGRQANVRGCLGPGNFSGKVFLQIVDGLVQKLCPFHTVSYTHLDVYKRQRTFDDYNTSLKMTKDCVAEKPLIAYQCKTGFLKRFLELSRCV